MGKNLPGATWNLREVKLRILYCSENYCPHDHRFLSALAASHHHTVYWFRLEGGDRLQEGRPLPEGIHVVDWGGGRRSYGWLNYPGLKQQFAEVIRRVKPDVIHAGPIQRVAFLAALADFHPLVSMSWGFDLLEDAHRNMLWRAVTRYTLGKTDWLIADCRTVQEMAARFGFPPGQVTVFPWGVDLHLFSPEGRASARKKIGFEKDLLIIHTRSWEPRYGVDVALDGLRLALEENLSIHMLMLGGGSQEDKINHYVHTNNLTEHVHFIGYQSNERLADYYRAGDIYLSASHVDGSSVALLEAMASGCVPGVSDISSNLEWVQDGVTGWAFQDGSAADLARVLASAAQADLRGLRVSARNKVEQDADWEKGKQQLLATYQSALSRNKK